MIFKSLKYEWLNQNTVEELLHAIYIYCQKKIAKS